MLAIETYPIVLTGDGSRRRPQRVSPIRDQAWRVEWVDGFVTFYRRDPRAHLRLGYEPKHWRRHA